MPLLCGSGDVQAADLHVISWYRADMCTAAGATTSSAASGRTRHGDDVDGFADRRLQKPSLLGTELSSRPRLPDVSLSSGPPVEAS